jgi:hypothetical protein
MSELLRPQQRVRQVHEQTGRDDQTDDVVECHMVLAARAFRACRYSRRSHADTYSTASAKKAIVMAT